MENATYKYDVLPQGRWFRQLHIHPGKPEDPIRCDMVAVSLDEAPPFKALSYVWGDPTQVASITCAEFQREVTVSLFEGLRRIRSPDVMEVAWADAICINQSDNAEKAQQVDLMGLIYDTATEVIVWLGKDPDNSAEDAFAGLIGSNYAVGTNTHNTWITVPGSEIALGEPNKDGDLQYYPIREYKSTLPSILTAPRLEAIKKLYRLTWFTRVWVLQEVGLATRATAYWGDRSIAFSEIAMFIHHGMSDENMITTLGQDVKDVISGPPYYAFWNVWSTYDKKGGWVDTTPVLNEFTKVLAAECNTDFVLVLEASRRFNATNPLDHVFAFLGHPKALLLGTGCPLIQANYRLDLPSLHLMVAARLAEQSLNFLVQVQNTEETLRVDNQVPSWVPQWNINIPDAPSAFWEAWDASLRLSHQAPWTASVTVSRLAVGALLFDTVSLHTDTMREADFDRYSSGAGKLIEECWNLTEQASKACPHIYGDEGAPLALASTITCNYRSSRNRENDDESLVEDFMQYCAIMNEEFYLDKLKRYGVEYRLLPMSQRLTGTKFTNYGTNRRFFVTRGGYWGLGPPLMQEDDVCAILFGGDVPFVLRPTSEQGDFQLVGQAYIYGIMYGEVVEKCKAGTADCKRMKIQLV
ncbi:heterokaryon incompatibility protein [Colletotrichum musicola]|uniref:Heterokaryon incompatibility protein n=1 Tax=Colletotrichum musicola TaxID=2175873 RepID=A0A8H6JC15_9PEZI|nr:heterokaryon incompatibility protein [Colletotrichum musicola]